MTKLNIMRSSLIKLAVMGSTPLARSNKTPSGLITSAPDREESFLSTAYEMLVGICSAFNTVRGIVAPPMFIFV